MSRAFTKEIDDSPAAPLADLPISRAPNFVTAHGAQMINSRVDELIASLLTASPAQRDVLRRDLRYWSSRAATMQILTPPDKPTSVRFGVTVELVRNGRLQLITIVGEDEADPAVGRIAWTSPLALVLDGAELAELVEFTSPGGSEMIEVKAIARGR